MGLRDFFDIFQHFFRIIIEYFSTFWTYNKCDFDLFFMDGGISVGVAGGDENSTFRKKSASTPNLEVKKVGGNP